MKVTLQTRVGVADGGDPLALYEDAIHAKGAGQAYLLESCGGPPIDNRTSHVGIGRLFEIQAWGEALRVWAAGPTVRRDVERVIADAGSAHGLIVRGDGSFELPDVHRMWLLLKDIRDSFTVLGDGAEQVQLLAHLGYEAARYTEDVYRDAGRNSSVPDISLALFRDHYIFEEAGVQQVQVANRAWEQDLQLGAGSSSNAATPARRTRSSFPQGAVTKAEYEIRVETCLERIRAGDIYQVQIGHEMQVSSLGSPSDLYRRLRSANPSPYMFLTGIGDHTLIGASPELFLRVEDGQATMRPIAGTARRMGHPEQDLRVATELAGDAKEVSEHIMLIDLCRNDLARVCRPDTVEVPSLMSVDNYSHVMHLVSTVQGMLRDDSDTWDAVAATFPAGTMTGAPKIRSMEIIAELETSSRGMYAGAVGHLGFAGQDANLALCIRTIAHHPMVGYSTRASAGVVIDSRPANEWNETLAKMQAGLSVGDDVWEAA